MGPQYKKNMEQGQQRSMKITEGLKHLSDEKGLRKMGMFSLEERMIGDLIHGCKNLMERVKKMKPDVAQWC